MKNFINKNTAIYIVLAIIYLTAGILFLVGVLVKIDTLTAVALGLAIVGLVTNGIISLMEKKRIKNKDKN